MGELPSDRADLIPELNRQPGDHAVTKRTWGAFTGTDLDEYLKKLGVTQVVIAGVATSLGVESTARQAHELGFNVTLAVDATCIDCQLSLCRATALSVLVESGTRGIRSAPTPSG